MKKEVVFTEKAPKAIGPYSQGVKVGELIFTSGQIPLVPESGVMVTEIKEATKQSLENVKSILEAAGSSLDKVVKVVVFIKDMDDFPVINEIYGEYFKENTPARSLVQVAKLPKDALLEIEAIAHI
ncbi:MULTISPECIES: Rid family detoxifying hydrolase [Clostridium]|uniref:Reactive intermediate/imine deaminase n=1 Tax=Clostridium cibarium TaxID=2762247 RepID=A0ABR8PW01_9CLOT|nr:MULTISPECIES: Rid family detoxifying hydrolase [Clostridium]MBD7912373.1 reactive intermediate/imine deaminase [Clostridium cibarium]